MNLSFLGAPDSEEINELWWHMLALSNLKEDLWRMRPHEAASGWCGGEVIAISKLISVSRHEIYVTIRECWFFYIDQTIIYRYPSPCIICSAAYSWYCGQVTSSISLIYMVILYICDKSITWWYFVIIFIRLLLFYFSFLISCWLSFRQLHCLNAQLTWSSGLHMCRNRLSILVVDLNFQTSLP